MPTRVPFNPFIEMSGITVDNIREIQEFRLNDLLNTGWNPEVGSTCRSASGRRYLYGPWFVERINQWQMFVIGTRRKRFGRIYHYSHYEDRGPTPWTDFVDRYRVCAPLDPIQAHHLANQINTLPASTALIFSGTLLSDLLGWAKENNVQIKRDIIFTTFEPFPTSRYDLLRESFDDWCDYMRVWEGGLTFWRCTEGTYHTLENACIMNQPIGGALHVTDLSNFAQEFVNHPTTERVSFTNHYETCKCGTIHCNFKLRGSSNWDLIDIDGQSHVIVNSMDDIPAGFQVYQPEKGKVILLSPVGSIDEQSIPEPIRAVMDNKGFDVQVLPGYLRRRDKLPPVFSAATSGRKYRVVGGYKPDVDYEFEPLSTT